MLAVTLWSFSHGLIQLAMAKGSDMGRIGIGIPALSDYGFGLLRFITQNLKPTTAGNKCSTLCRGLSRRLVDLLKNAIASHHNAQIILGARQLGEIHELPEKVSQDFANIYAYLRQNPM